MFAFLPFINNGKIFSSNLKLECIKNLDLNLVEVHFSVYLLINR